MSTTRNRFPWWAWCALPAAVAVVMGAVDAREAAVRLAGLTALVVGAVVVKTGILALSLTYLLVTPAGVRSSARLLQERPKRMLLIGLGTLVIITLLVALTGAMPGPVRPLLIVIEALLVLLLLLHGLTACYLALGERLHANTLSPATGSSFWATLHGGLLLGLVDLVPVAGQVADLLVMLCALGVATCALRPARTQPAAAGPAAPAP